MPARPALSPRGGPRGLPRLAALPQHEVSRLVRVRVRVRVRVKVGVRVRVRVKVRSGGGLGLDVPVASL